MVEFIQLTTDLKLLKKKKEKKYTKQYESNVSTLDGLLTTSELLEKTADWESICALDQMLEII